MALWWKAKVCGPEHVGVFELHSITAAGGRGRAHVTKKRPDRWDCAGGPRVCCVCITACRGLRWMHSRNIMSAATAVEYADGFEVHGIAAAGRAGGFCLVFLPLLR